MKDNLDQVVKDIRLLIAQECSNETLKARIEDYEEAKVGQHETIVMEQPTLDLCSDYDIGCRIDEKDNVEICEDCFYGKGFEESLSWEGADGYCPILRKAP